MYSPHLGCELWLQNPVLDETPTSKNPISVGVVCATRDRQFFSDRICFDRTYLVFFPTDGDRTVPQDHTSEMDKMYVVFLQRDCFQIRALACPLVANQRHH